MTYKLAFTANNRMVCMKVFVVVLTAAVTLSARSFNRNLYVGTYPSANESSVQVYIGLMLSLSGDQQSTGALAGVQAALDDINSRDDLLPGYSLHYTLTDSQVCGYFTF